MNAGMCVLFLLAIYIHVPALTCIQKANLFKETDFKTDTFSSLFTDVLFSVFCHLPDIYKN
jgi:hypothetical protein